MDTVNAGTFRDVMLMLFGLVGVATGLVIIWTRLRPTQVSPQPLVVKNADQFVSKEFCAGARNETDKRLTQVERDVRDMREHQSKQIKEAYDKMEQFREEVVEQIREEGDKSERSFKDMERAIGRIEGAIKNGHKI